MQKQIEELAIGKAAHKPPAISCSTEKVEIAAFPGQAVSGEFTISGADRAFVRGVVYASHPRMKCLTESFAGDEAVIRYEFCSVGMEEGEGCEGAFSIAYDGGEWDLPFAASVVRPRIHTSGRTIDNLDDFTNLAKRDWQEAVRLFFAPSFASILGKGRGREKLLHEGLLKGTDADRSLEEFLLACREKEQIFITPSRTEFSFSDVTDRLRADLKLTRNTWGYIELEVSSDMAFLIPQKTRITTEDFLGKEADFCFYIDGGQLHAGKNFGRISFRNSYQELTLTVCAMPEGNGTKANMQPRKIRALHIDLLKLYLSYRFNHIQTGQWAKGSCGILDDLLAISKDNAWYMLLKAQSLLGNGQRQDAEWILDEFKRKYRDQKSPQWGYYMYLCTMMDHEELFVTRMTEAVEQIFLENREHTMLFFALLSLRREYEGDPGRKLLALKERIAQGDYSPLLYAEVYYLFLSEPYRIGRLGNFEITILYWACRHGLLTQSLASQLISVFPANAPFRKTFFSLLKYCCAIADVKDALGTICSYLIRNQKYGQAFFEWYARGVEEKLRIAGLYEAYLMSMDFGSIREVPRIIQMYFKYNIRLGSRLKAMLYANIAAHKQDWPGVYAQHYPEMAKFACGQLMKRRMDENLAVLYQEILANGIVSPELSDALSDVLFLHRLICFGKGAVRAIVLQAQLKDPIFVPFTGQTAYVPLYSNEYCILIEDAKGNRFSVGMECQLEKLLHPGRYFEACMAASAQKLPYLLFYFSKRKAFEIFGERDIPRLLCVMEDMQTDDSYRNYLFPKLFGLLCRAGMSAEMKQMLHRADLSRMQKEDRQRIFQWCIEAGLYEEAYQMIRGYGLFDADAGTCVLLLNGHIRDAENSNDTDLCGFCAQTFFRGKYNDAMLAYLCHFYRGPIERMKQIYECAKAFGIDAWEIAGRILAHALYTGQDLSDWHLIFESYEEKGNPQLKNAFLGSMAHKSMMEQKGVPDECFLALKRHMAYTALNEICALALLEGYAGRPALCEKDAECVEELLQQCLSHGSYLPFFRRLPAGMLRKYLPDGRYVIEHRTKRDCIVRIFYQNSTDKAGQYEEMTEACEGIYIKKILLFAGEEIRYQIFEEAGGHEEEAKSGILACEAVGAEAKSGRYGRLNEMLCLRQEGNTERLMEKMREYEHLDRLKETIFTLL